MSITVFPDATQAATLNTAWPFRVLGITYLCRRTGLPRRGPQLSTKCPKLLTNFIKALTKFKE